MAIVKKSIAFLFLGIFLVIKTSPAFFSGALLPVASAVNSFFPVKSIQPASHGVFLIRLDRCVIDSDPVNKIPKIKITGALFSLLAVNIFLIITLKFKSFSALCDFVYPTGKYLSLCVLRI